MQKTNTRSKPTVEVSIEWEANDQTKTPHRRFETGVIRRAVGALNVDGKRPGNPAFDRTGIDRQNVLQAAGGVWPGIRSRQISVIGQNQPGTYAIHQNVSTPDTWTLAGPPDSLVVWPK